MWIWLQVELISQAINLTGYIAMQTNYEILPGQLLHEYKSISCLLWLSFNLGIIKYYLKYTTIIATYLMCMA